MDEGADGTDVAAVYLFSWLEQIGNRLNGVFGLLSKMREWTGVD